MAMDPSSLQVSLEEGERWRRTLSITIPADIVKAERAAAVRKLSSRVRLPGFRAGKVPVSVIERRFGPALDRELLDRVIGEAYRGILEDRELRPISEGEVSDVSYEPGADLTFQVSFDVAPRIELARTSGFQVERRRMTVGDEEVEKVLLRLREQEGTWVPVDEGPPEEGDQVSVRIQRLEVEGDDPRPYEFVLGRDQAIPDVEAAIRTLAPGEEDEFVVAFPEDFPDEEKRGTSDRLRVFLDGRKRLEPAEEDDAFAARVGDFESLEALRARIRSDLEEEADEEAEGALRRRLLEEILAANPFQVPTSMIDQYLQSILGDERKLSPEEMAGAREQLGAQAEVAVKRFLVIEELARTHALHATAEEVDARVEEIAERSKTSPGEVYARLQRSGRLERLEQEITEDKVFEHLKAGSTIKDAT
jgi:trigger factor